ncbi:MAG: hypothetical protein JSV81_02690 [Anaerolineales bacterium]|nr:MAG: hypothetical protein JSV81_02690 [Anaerolineales bacterium]
MTEYHPRARSNTTRNIIIAVVVLIVLCCCCLIAVYGSLALMGPAVGNVFSNIVEGLEITPVP